MTTVEPAVADSADAEPQQSRAAGIVVLAIAGAAAGGVVYVVPETGYFVAGLMATATVRKARNWAAGRREGAVEEPEPVADELDVGNALRRLVGDDRGVLLTRLRDDLALPDTRTVRSLLDAADIRVRSGVRTSAGNGPGVHRDDIPAPSPTTSGPSSECCLCSSEAANANTNNRPDIVQDEHNPNRWHVVKEVAQ